MKKILALLTVLLVTLLITMGTSSAATTDWDSAAQVKRVQTIGTKILSANKLPSGITFKVSEEDDVNAYANINKEVYVYKGLLQFVENDQELAAVIAHEVGHIVNAHCAKQTIIDAAANTALANANISNTKLASGVSVGKELGMLKLSRTDEYDADLTGVDLMIKAGYDPKAMISVLNKICSNSIDVISTHPSGINRLMNIYDYTAYVYPANLKSTSFASDSYKTAYVTISENVNGRNAKKNGEAKHNKKMAKLKEKRVKQMTKNAKRTSDPWTSSVTIINSLTK